MSFKPQLLRVNRRMALATLTIPMLAHHAAWAQKNDRPKRTADGLHGTDDGWCIGRTAVGV